MFETHLKTPHCLPGSRPIPVSSYLSENGDCRLPTDRKPVTGQRSRTGPDLTLTSPPAAARRMTRCAGPPCGKCRCTAPRRRCPAPWHRPAAGGPAGKSQLSHTPGPPVDTGGVSLSHFWGINSTSNVFMQPQMELLINWNWKVTPKQSVKSGDWKWYQL